jgi:uncharacterized membrane protein YgdD (TMEM256/DUF423 family)
MNNKTLQKNLLTVGCIICGLSVALGAFAAHGLKDALKTEMLDVFETGVKYQFYHGLGILLLYAMQRRLHESVLTRVFYLFITGIIIFSGSLFILATRELTFGDILKPLGMITPIGGLSFIIGWSYLGISGYKATEHTSKKHRNESPIDANKEAA